MTPIDGDDQRIAFLQQQVDELNRWIKEQRRPPPPGEGTTTVSAGGFPVALSNPTGSATTVWAYTCTSLDGQTVYGVGKVPQWNRIIPSAYCVAATRGWGFIDPDTEAFTLEFAYETYEHGDCVTARAKA